MVGTDNLPGIERNLENYYIVHYSFGLVSSGAGPAAAPDRVAGNFEAKKTAPGYLALFAVLVFGAPGLLFLENHVGSVRAGCRVSFAHFVHVATPSFHTNIVGVIAIVGYPAGNQ